MTKITQQLGGKASQELGCLALHHMLTQESGSMQHNNRVVLKH